MAPPVQLTPREITRIQTTMHNFDAELRVALASGQFAHIKKVFDAMVSEVILTLLMYILTHDDCLG